MNVALADEFRDDLDEACFSLLVREPVLAQRLLVRIDRAIQLIAGSQVTGRQVQLIGGEMVQRWPVTPYVIYYGASPEGITMVRMRHQARQPIER